MSYLRQDEPVPTPDDIRARRLFWWLQTGGWVGYGLVSYLSALAHGKPVGYWPMPLGIFIAGFLVTLGIRAVLRRAWGRPPAAFVPIAAACVVAGSTLLGLVFVMLYSNWCPDCRPTSTLAYFAYATGHLYVVLSWVGLYVGLKYYRQWQQQTRQALAATAMAHQAQLKMLRYQLNPHFLFNTLNAISTLVHRDAHAADEMITQLSDLLRLSLDSIGVQEVRLGQEVEFLSRYLDIQRTRFQDRLKVDVNVPEHLLQVFVPNQVLQPIAENAIKHGLATRPECGRIEVSARRSGHWLDLAVRDDGPGFRLGPEGLPMRGIGLRNTRERLRELYGPGAVLTLSNHPDGGAVVRLRLPIGDAAALSASVEGVSA